MPSLIRACDGSDEGPECKTKWRKKGELLDKLQNGISPSAFEHDGLKGKNNLFHKKKNEEVAGSVKATYCSIECEISWQVVVTPTPTKKTLPT